MAPKVRSTKAPTAKASLGFASTKKGAAGTAKQQSAKSLGAQKLAASSSETAGKSELAGLYPRLYKKALREMGTPSESVEKTFVADPAGA